MTATDARASGDGKVSAVNALVQEIVGLSFDDFKKCIALPQGEFAQFVKAEKSERLKLIARLFGLEEYGEKLNARVREKYGFYLGRRSSAKENFRAWRTFPRKRRTL